MVNLVCFIIVNLLKASHRLRIYVFLDALTFFLLLFGLAAFEVFQKKVLHACSIDRSLSPFVALLLPLTIVTIVILPNKFVC